MSLKQSFLATTLLLSSFGAALAQDSPIDTVRPKPAPGAFLTAPARLPSDLLPSRQQAAVAAAVAKTSSAPWSFERPKPQTPAAAIAGGKPEGEIDLSALRYYASQNDLARVSAEIRLLRAKHPNWEPPQDLFSEMRSTVSEQPLWDLFSKHDMEGLKAAMDDLRQTNPDWQPSTDLANKIKLSEARDVLIRASDAQQWSDVVDVASDNKMLMTCSDVDAMWRTAEALVRISDEPHAVEAYRYILTNCSKPEERLATVQKASVLLQGPGALETLVALGRRDRSGRNEFEFIKLDGSRQRIGNASAGKDGTQPTSSDIEAISAAYAASKKPADAQLLGWYAYSQKNFPEAEKWFKYGLDGKPEAKSAEGMVLALRSDGKLQDALDIATQYQGLDHPNAKVFIEIVSALLLDPKATVTPKPEQIEIFRTAIDAEKSADGAQANGWYLYGRKEVAAAESWFKKAMDWKPSEDAAVGLMVCAKQLKHEADYAQIVSKYKGTYARVAQLETVLRSSRGTGGRKTAARSHGGKGGGGGGGWDASANSIVSTFQSGNYDGALAMLDARKGSKSEPHGLGLIRGWAQYKKGDWDGAKQTFTALERQQPTTSAETGLRVIEEGLLPKQFR